MVSQYTNWFILRFSQKIFRGVFPYDDQTTKGDYKKKLLKGGVVQHFICDQLLYLVNDVINHPRGHTKGPLQGANPKGHYALWACIYM